MTAMDIRTSINNGLAGFTPDMLLVVDDFVKSLRRRIVEPAEDSPVFPDMDKEFYSPEEAYGLVMKDINAEERAYWAQSAERTSPIAYSTEQARSLVTDRLNRLENGQAETVGHAEVKRHMEALLS